MLSKLMQFDHTFRSKWQTILAVSINDTELNLDQQELIDNTLRDLVESGPAYQVLKLGHTFDDYMDWEFFKCASDEMNPTRPCR